MSRNVIELARRSSPPTFNRLREQIREVAKAGADRIRVDVMDGHFVPNRSMGAAIVEFLRRVTALSLETHLMIMNPDLFLEEFSECW